MPLWASTLCLLVWHWVRRLAVVGLHPVHLLRRHQRMLLESRLLHLHHVGVHELRVGELIRIIAGERAVGPTSGSHRNLLGDVGLQSSVQVDVLALEMGSESTVLHRQIVVVFFVHFFIDDILLRDAERAASATLVDLRSSSRRLDSRFQAAVTTAGSGDVRSRIRSQR